MICLAVTTWLIADLKVLKMSVQTSKSPAAYILLNRRDRSRAGGNWAPVRVTFSRVSRISLPWSRRSASRPLRPTASTFTSLPSRCKAAMRRRVSRAMLALKPAASPRSLVTITSRCFCSLPWPDSSFGAMSRVGMLAIRPASMRSMLSA